MTEQQQLINRYIKGLSLASSTVYMLHFLYETDDPESISMLKDSLNEARSRTKNSQIEKFINEPNPLRNFGRHDSKTPQVKSNGSECPIQAQALFSQLKFEDALKLYSISVHEYPDNGKFYKERAELCLLLNNYKKAISLSKKGHCDDIFLAASAADGNLSMISSMFEIFLRNITNNSFVINSVISRYEFEIILVIFSFSYYSSRGLKRKTDVIFENSSFNHEKLKEMVDLFSNRQFSLFLEKLPEIEKILNFSMYSSHSSSKFIRAIQENVVINEVMPFSIVKLEDIQNNLEIPMEDIKEFLLKGIKNQQLNGKLNLVDNVFIGAISNLLNFEINSYYNRIIGDLQELQLSIWKKRYNKENKAKKEKLFLNDQKLLQADVKIETKTPDE